MRNIKRLFLHTALILISLSSTISFADIVKLDSCQIEIKNHSKQKYKKSLYFLNGVTSSSYVFKPLIRELRRNGFNLKTMSLPLGGQSKLKGVTSWKTISSCLREYFSKKDDYIVLLHDHAAAIYLSQLASFEKAPLGVIVMNGIIRPSEYNFHHPLSLFEDKIGSSVTSRIYPKFLYKKEILNKLVSNPSKLNDDDFDIIYNQTIGENSKEIAQYVQSFPKDPKLDQIIRKSLRRNDYKQFVLWGVADPILKNQLQFLDESSKNPSRTTYYLKKGKHFPMWEFPQEIASVIKQWLESNNM